jgi:hypothetical protein
MYCTWDLLVCREIATLLTTVDSVGGWAVSKRSLALRPHLAAGLP